MDDNRTDKIGEGVMFVHENVLDVIEEFDRLRNEYTEDLYGTGKE